MKNALALSVAVCSCILSGCDPDTSGIAKPSVTKEARTAVDALRKLQIKTSVGINYRDYASAVADTLFPVTEYLKSPEGSKDIETNKIIHAVANDYLIVSRVWAAKLDDTYLDDKPEYGKYGSLSVLVSMQYSENYTNDKDWLEPDRAIQMIWSHASKELAKLE